MAQLAEGGAAVGTPPLTQGEAEEKAQREEEDGAEDPQTGKVVLQDADPDKHTEDQFGQSDASK